MKKGVLGLMILSLLVFLGGASLIAQEAGGGAQQSPSTTTNHVVHHVVHHVHHVVHHHVANPAAKYEAGVHTASGTLTTVDTSGKLLIVTESDGTPFNFVVAPGTRIEVNGQKGSLDALAGQTNQQVTVKFRDHLTHGLIAQSVQVGG